MPARSRHCKWEFSIGMPLSNDGKVIEDVDHEPGDLPVFDAIRPTRIGRCTKDSGHNVFIHNGTEPYGRTHLLK
jgi:hypothetical protein